MAESRSPGQGIPGTSLGLLLCACLSLSPVAGRAAEAPFILHGVDGTRTRAALKAVLPDGVIEYQDDSGQAKSVRADSLLKLERESAPIPLPTKEGMILLPEGDRLSRVDIGQIVEESLQVRSQTLGELKLPIEAVSAIVFSPPTDPDARVALTEELGGGERRSDLVRLSNGDELLGTVLGLDADAARVKSENGELKLNRSEIDAIGFDPGLADYPKPEGRWWRLSLRDGSALGLAELSLAGDAFEGKTRPGTSIRIPAAEVIRIACCRPSLVFLSEIDPLRAQYVPFIGPVLPFRQDLAVDGHPFQVGRQTYDRGLGTQSRTLLAYRVGAKDLRFQASVAVDDRAGPLGSVVFRVLVDGKERFASPPMTSGDPPIPIDVELEGAKFLILATEFGERGNTRDLADWLEARLIRNADRGAP